VPDKQGRRPHKHVRRGAFYHHLAKEHEECVDGSRISPASPVLDPRVALQPKHSLIDQSLHSRLGARRPMGRLRSRLVWSRREAGDVSQRASQRGTTETCKSSAGTLSRDRVFAHIRASSGSPINRRTATRSARTLGCGCTTGSSREFQEVKRDRLALKIAPSTPRSVRGPPFGGSDRLRSCSSSRVPGRGAGGGGGWWWGGGGGRGRGGGSGRGLIQRGRSSERVGLIEETGTSDTRASSNPIQMTVATSDGAQVWALRYASAGPSRSAPSTRQTCSTLRTASRQPRPSNGLSDEVEARPSRGPRGDLDGAWNEGSKRRAGGHFVRGQDEQRAVSPPNHLRRTGAGRGDWWKRPPTAPGWPGAPACPGVTYTRARS
jgi:glutamine amidotransferase